MSEIWKALLEVQKEAPALQRDGLNPHFKSGYVTLETLMGSILPILNKRGIVLMQGTDHHDCLITRLTHAESGEEVASVMQLHMAKNDAQGYGAAMTYARRYAIMGMLGLVADADDDGNAASKAPESRSKGTQKVIQPIWPPSNYPELEALLAPYGVWDDWVVSGGQAKELLFGGEQVLSTDQKAKLWAVNLTAANWLMENFSPDALPPPSKTDVANAWSFALVGKQP